MKRFIAALATAAAMTVAVQPVAAQEMGMEFNMLTGAVYNMLNTRDLPTDNLDRLRLSEIATIKGILDSDDSEGQKTQRIRQIISTSDSASN